MFKYFFVFLFFISLSAKADQDIISNNFSSLLLFPLLFVLMYFLLIRPQTKKVKEHKDLLENLKLNDEITTQCGMLGKIVKITEQFVVLLLNDNIAIIVRKESISSVLPKGTMKQIK